MACGSLVVRNGWIHEIHYTIPWTVAVCWKFLIQKRKKGLGKVWLPTPPSGPTSHFCPWANHATAGALMSESSNLLTKTAAGESRKMFGGGQGGLIGSVAFNGSAIFGPWACGEGWPGHQPACSSALSNRACASVWCCLAGTHSPVPCPGSAAWLGVPRRRVAARRPGAGAIWHPISPPTYWMDTTGNSGMCPREPCLPSCCLHFPKIWIAYPKKPLSD